jgi:hypothetical protein
VGSNLGINIIFCVADGSRIRYLEFEIRDSRSRIRDPISEIHDPESRMEKYQDTV